MKDETHMQKDYLYFKKEREKTLKSRMLLIYYNSSNLELK